MLICIDVSSVYYIYCIHGILAYQMLVHDILYQIYVSGGIMCTGGIIIEVVTCMYWYDMMVNECALACI